jgi:predicted GNAT superfamily acetyltransferase
MAKIQAPTDTGVQAPPDVSKLTVRACHSHADLRLCVDLQRRVWGFEDEDVVPAAIFVVALHTGGHVYCSYPEHDGDRPVGFALAFSAEHHDGRRFWHSHMVGVLPEYQNKGVGRLLKLHQRDEALRLGIPVIEWTFDPLEVRNAYFNVARLGAIIRRYIPDCYGGSSSPLHGSLPTDRLVAEWHLRSTHVEDALAGRDRTRDGAIRIPMNSRIRELQHSDREKIQADLRLQFADLFSRNYAVTGFRRGDEICEYVLEPYED